MRPFRRSLWVTLALALLAGVAGALIGVRMAGEPPREDALHAVLHEELGLSAEQTRRIEAEERLYERSQAQAETAVRRANARLADAIRTSGRNGPEVQAAIEQVHVALGEYQKETVAHIFRMREVLTPAQAQVFDATVANALTADAR